MDSGPPPSGQAPPTDSRSDRLDSWKTIALYLARDVRTAQRWEQTEHLPVHRPPNSKRGSVYAFKSEIDEWWKGRYPIFRQGANERDALTLHGKPRRTVSSGFRFVIYTILILVVLLTLGAARLLFSPRVHSKKTQTPSRITVAVLPFKNLSPDQSDQTLAAWLTHQVNASLEKTSGLRVIPILLDQSRPDDPAPEQMARQNRVQAIVEGAVSRSGSKIKVRVQLLDASTGRMISADEFERNSDTSNTAGNDVAQLISDSVRRSLLPSSHTP